MNYREIGLTEEFFLLCKTFITKKRKADSDSLSSFLSDKLFLISRPGSAGRTMHRAGSRCADRPESASARMQILPRFSWLMSPRQDRADGHGNVVHFLAGEYFAAVHFPGVEDLAAQRGIKNRQYLRR